MLFAFFAPLESTLLYLGSAIKLHTVTIIIILLTIIIITILIMIIIIIIIKNYRQTYLLINKLNYNPADNLRMRLSCGSIILYNKQIAIFELFSYLDAVFPSDCCWTCLLSQFVCNALWTLACMLMVWRLIVLQAAGAGYFCSWFATEWERLAASLSTW